MSTKTSSVSKFDNRSVLVNSAGEDTKRLNVNLPLARFEALQDLSRRTGLTMTTLVRWGMGTVERLIEDVEKGNRIVITDKSGNTLRELVIPL